MKAKSVPVLFLALDALLLTSGHAHRNLQVPDNGNKKGGFGCIPVIDCCQVPSGGMFAASTPCGCRAVGGVVVGHDYPWASPIRRGWNE